MTTLAARSAIISSLMAISERTHIVSEAAEVIFAPLLPQETLHTLGSVGPIALMTILVLLAWQLLGPLLRFAIKVLTTIEWGRGRINELIGQAEAAFLDWGKRLLRLALITSAKRAWNFAKRFRGNKST